MREAHNGLVDKVNPFAELKSAWAIYTAAIFMFVSVQYVIIFIMLIAEILKYGVSEFSHVLLSAIYVDLYVVVDRKHNSEESTSPDLWRWS